jgi:hypothetical protein
MDGSASADTSPTGLPTRLPSLMTRSFTCDLDLHPTLKPLPKLVRFCPGHCHWHLLDIRARWQALCQVAVTLLVDDWHPWLIRLGGRCRSCCHEQRCAHAVARAVAACTATCGTVGGHMPLPTSGSLLGRMYCADTKPLCSATCRQSDEDRIRLRPQCLHSRKSGPNCALPPHHSCGSTCTSCLQGCHQCWQSVCHLQCGILVWQGRTLAQRATCEHLLPSAAIASQEDSRQRKSSASKRACTRCAVTHCISLALRCR